MTMSQRLDEARLRRLIDEATTAIVRAVGAETQIDRVLELIVEREIRAWKPAFGADRLAPLPAA